MMRTRSNTKKLIMLLLVLGLLGSQAACVGGGNDKNMDQKQAEEPNSGGMDESDEPEEPETEEEAVAMYKSLQEQEQEIFSKNTQLWEQVYLNADKGMAMLEDGKNYGDFLLDTINSAEDQFTKNELKLLRREARKIRKLEKQQMMLENKYPSVAQKALDSAMDMSADSGQAMADDAAMQSFPEFEGKDLDGNAVSSRELFAGNAVTVVNFWFTSCSPCVGELPELEALDKELQEKGGALIGINAYTLDGDQQAISEAKDVLAKKGASYQNVYAASDSELGKFTEQVYAYPTTYVVDRSGRIAGEPIVGAITGNAQAEALQKLIDQVLAADAE